MSPLVENPAGFYFKAMANFTTINLPDYSGKSCLLVTGEQIFQQLSMGSDWEYLRIGMLASIENSPSGYGFPFLFFGLSNGTNGFNTFGPKNILGYVYTQYNGGVFASDNNIPVFGGAIRGFYKTGELNLDSQSYGYSGVLPAKTGSAGYQMAPLYIDIKKGSPNYTVAFYAADTGFHRTGVYSVADFVSGLDQPTGTIGTSITLKGMLFPKVGTSTLACNESGGGFDTMSLYWNHPSKPLYLYAWGAEQK